MEIKSRPGDKINIPANCKAIIKDGLITIEEKQDDFKDGDILHSKTSNIVVIFKNYTSEANSFFCSYYNTYNTYQFDWDNLCFRHATEEEKQKFFDELNKKGLRWNAETKELEKIRKRVKGWGTYLKVNMYGEVLAVTECDSILDAKAFNIGNYYLPEEREQAEADAQKIRAIFQERLK